MIADGYQSELASTIQKLADVLDELSELLRRGDENREQPSPEDGGVDGNDAPLAAPDLDAETLHLGELEQVREWLGARGVALCGVNTSLSDFESAMLVVARLFGDHFEDLESLHDAVRSTLNSTGRFSVKMGQCSGETIGRNVALAQNLASLGVFLDVRYDKASRVLTGRTQISDGRIINFFTGRWFELWVRDRLLAALERRPSSVFSNLTLSLPNGQTREMDLLAFVHGQPLWIECKTGEPETYLQRFRELREVLHIDPRRSVLALLQVNATVSDQLTKIWGIEVIGRKDLPGALADIINSGPISHDGSASDAMAASPSVVGSLESYLRHRDLRPLPGLRTRLLGVLVTVWNESGPGTTLGDLSQVLASRVPEASRAVARELLKALYLGGAFNDFGGVPLASMASPVAEIVSLCPEELLRHCALGYARAILNADADWFSSESNKREFTTVTDCPPPTQSELEALLQGWGADGSSQAAE